ncbi:class I SAM-dependent methyltransferase [Sulfurospirillum oryzae]|uniref:class I SAM-dependent methyltransferase n=1 Tax=Sulfurospirillum oryzae TaxID=2976535 RepID=UPI0021E8FEA3|nr:class I SAM-dependent methyltransferase [Sulfurospirillum oryzae]
MSEQWKASDYASNSKGQAVWANELIEKMELKGDESILDIGCGDGKITDVLSRHTCGEVVGIDFSSEMITYAKAAFSKPTFLQMDAQALSFGERFDVVFSNAALHWVKDHKAVLEGIYKALKPKGRAILQMGGAGNGEKVFEALGQIFPHYATYFEAFEMPYTFHSDKTYEVLLSDMDFSSHTTSLVFKDMVHEDVKAFQGWIETTWFPFINPIPREKKAAFIKEWIEAYLALCPVDHEGRVHVAMMRLQVELIK